MKKDDIGRMEDILTCIEKIEKYTTEGKNEFLKNELIQNFFVHHIQIIGEAARALSDDFKNKNTNIPWKDIIGMRHFIVHQYLDVDLETVWEVVNRDLPKLKDKMKNLLP